MTETNLFPSPSEYDEHQELLELMAEDRRRRHLDAQGDARTVPRTINLRVDPITVQNYVNELHAMMTRINELHVIPYQVKVHKLPRSYRRARGRRVARARAYFRNVDRSRTARRSSARLVIKKGLTR